MERHSIAYEDTGAIMVEAVKGNSLGSHINYYCFKAHFKQQANCFKILL